MKKVVKIENDRRFSLQLVAFLYCTVITFDFFSFQIFKLVYICCQCSVLLVALVCLFTPTFGMPFWLTCRPTTIVVSLDRCGENPKKIARFFQKSVHICVGWLSVVAQEWFI